MQLDQHKRKKFKRDQQVTIIQGGLFDNYYLKKGIVLAYLNNGTVFIRLTEKDVPHEHVSLREDELELTSHIKKK